MATTHLTDAEAQQYTLRDLIRRVTNGEKILVETAAGPVLLSQPPAPPMDATTEATLQRLRKLEQETGEPLRMGADFADDLEKIIAMRRPGHGDPWA